MAGPTVLSCAQIKCRSPRGVIYHGGLKGNKFSLAAGRRGGFSFLYAGYLRFISIFILAGDRVTWKYVFFFCFDVSWAILGVGVRFCPLGIRNDV